MHHTEEGQHSDSFPAGDSLLSCVHVYLLAGIWDRLAQPRYIQVGDRVRWGKVDTVWTSGL